MNTDTPIEPTRDEAKNGWTAESLTRYVGERLAAQYGSTAIGQGIDDFRPWGERHNPNRPKASDSRYNPMRW